MSNQIQEPLVQLEWDAAHELLANAQTIVTLTHIQPDGDAIGSVMGLTLALREQGKVVYPVVEGGCPDSLRFVPFSEDIRATADDLQPDLIISTDASDIERLGSPGQNLLERGLPLIQLDHHQTNIMFGAVNLVDARTCSAAEGVLDWLDELGHEVSPLVAQCLLTGIVTDTLCFRTFSVTPVTLDKARRLMLAGADLSAVVQRTVSRTSLSHIRLQAEVLPHLQVEDGVAWLTLKPENFYSAGLAVEEHTGLSGYLIQAADAMVSATFTLTEDGAVQCSFRAKPGFDVSSVAFKLGGGGHVLASGCTIREVSLEEAVERVVPLLKNAVELGSLRYA